MIIKKTRMSDETYAKVLAFLRLPKNQRLSGSDTDSRKIIRVLNVKSTTEQTVRCKKEDEGAFYTSFRQPIQWIRNVTRGDVDFAIEEFKTPDPTCNVAPPDWEKSDVSLEYIDEFLKLIGFSDGTGIMPEELHLAEVIKDGDVKAFVDSLYSGKNVTRLEPKYMLMAYLLARRLVSTIYGRAIKLKKNQNTKVLDLIIESVSHAGSYVRDERNGRDTFQLLNDIQLLGVELPGDLEENVLKYQIVELAHSLLTNDSELTWWKNEVLGITTK